MPCSEHWFTELRFELIKSALSGEKVGGHEENGGGKWKLNRWCAVDC